MKNFKTISGAIIKPVFGLLAIALTVTSCSKDNDNGTSPGVATLAIVHAAPGTPELNLAIGGVKTNLKGLTFGTFINYANINEGLSEFGVTKKDSTRILTKSSLALKNGKAYSLFITDVPAKTAFALVEDDLTAPVTDKANLRFVNMSPDAGSLDLAITGQATALTTNTVFKGATAFTAVTPGTEVNFEIRANTKPDVLAKIEKVKIEKGKIYTIWAKGLKAATDTTKLSLKLITNK